MRRCSGALPEIAATPCAPIPLGGEVADFDGLRCRPGRMPVPRPGGRSRARVLRGHPVAAGLRDARGGARRGRPLRDRRPDLYRRLRLHFFGTGNQADAGRAPRVLPIARELSVADRVTEVAAARRLPGRTHDPDASARDPRDGSSEPHYTASRLYPALLAGGRSSPCITNPAAAWRSCGVIARPPAVRLVTYTDAERAPARVEVIAAELSALDRAPRVRSSRGGHGARSMPSRRGRWRAGWPRSWIASRGTR